MDRMRRILLNLCIGELVAVLVFWFAFYQWIPKIKANGNVWVIAFPLIVLSFILLQGTAYWSILLRRLQSPQFAVSFVKPVYSVLKFANLIFIVLCIPVILLLQASAELRIVGVAITIFALIEWVNYFKYRLSYSMNPLVLFGKIKRGEWNKSRLAKEIEK